MPHKSLASDDLTFAFETIGQSVKVTATDALNGVEVSLVAPEGVTQTELRREATAKLEYVLRKRAEEAAEKGKS